MRNKFLFFSYRKSAVLNLLIIFQIALWLFYVSSLVSLLNFDNSYKNRYNRSFPTKNSKIMVFYKMIAKMETVEDEEKDRKILKNILNYLETNNYKFGMLQRKDAAIPMEVLGINSKTIKSNFTKSEIYYNKLYPIKMNYEMVKSYKENISGKINFDQWKEKNNSIPVILGQNFSKKFKIGDTFTYKSKKYTVMCFFKKDTLAFDHTGPVDSSFLLNGSMIIPLDLNNYIENFNYTPIVLYFNNSNEKNIKKLEEDLSNITPDADIENFNENLEEFLKKIETEKNIEIFRVFIISLIATASIATTIYYKISSNKDKIGVLFSVGISKSKIFEMFTFEFSINVIIGILCGSYFYLKNCKNVYAFFINENLIFNLYSSMFILLIIVICVLITGFNKINKLSPKEMVGGFIE